MLSWDKLFAANLPLMGQHPYHHYSTIADVPPNLVQSFHMIIFHDRSHHKVMLQIPNDLGWNYHYGIPCHCPSDLKSEAQDHLKAHLPWAAAPASSLQPAGLMFFTFNSRNDEKDPILPFRVHVWECACDDSSALSSTTTKMGTWYDYSSVPYDNMWADDRLWMPQLLRGQQYFQGHFAFDGPPGPTSPLVGYAMIPQSTQQPS